MHSLFPVVVAVSALFTAAAAFAQLPPPTEAKSGRAQGWVVNSAGQPLNGATVHIYGTTMAGENTRFEKPVGRDGKFAQRLPDGIYGLRVEYPHAWNGRTFTMALHPIDGITSRSHDSEEGIAKDFVWKIAGLRPGQAAGEEGSHNEPGKYWGGSLQVSFETDPAIPDGTTLVATLTPQGPLFDGSAGRPVTYRRTFGGNVRTSSYWYPSDIPLGVYELRISMQAPGGAARPLMLKQSLDFKGDFGPSTRVDVIPDASSGTALPIQITVKP